MHPYLIIYPFEDVGSIFPVSLVYSTIPIGILFIYHSLMKAGFIQNCTL